MYQNLSYKFYQGFLHPLNMSEAEQILSEDGVTSGLLESNNYP